MPSEAVSFGKIECPGEIRIGQVDILVGLKNPKFQTAGKIASRKMKSRRVLGCPLKCPGEKTPRRKHSSVGCADSRP